MSTIRDLAEAVQTWHQDRTTQLQTIIDTPATTEIRLDGGDSTTVLTGDKATGFRAGVAVALSLFGKLPFTFDAPAPADEVQTKVMEVLVDILAIDGDEHPDNTLRSHLMADDSDLAEIVQKLNEAFDIDMEADLGELRTIQDLLDLVRATIAAKAAV